MRHQHINISSNVKGDPLFKKNKKKKLGPRTWIFNFVAVFTYASIFLFFFFCCVFFIALGLGQDLILRFPTGKRNIQGDTRTTGSFGAITVASGGPTTSGAEDGASFLVDAISVEVVATTTITTTTTTIAPTGKTTGRILKNSSRNDNSSSSSGS